ncbi:MAG: aminoacyl-histidine dipeptidase [Chromatiaceae bacterium]|nr:aminoacyl-histidine dipeptidase [Chromatiaceae bacterium]MCP5444424.1 aminoacyl-histidine dipeptidase [Chromatiaceae bacterium]
MSQDIEKLTPPVVWRQFYRLTTIPRPSRHEKQVRDFLVAFGRDRGLETRVDEVGNVIVRKPATEGRESRPGVILQGHMDMVPQANAGSCHDFTRDPILTRVDGDWVKAEGTTLGADNGIGVAAILAVLGSTDLVHGPIEALFTCNEESGMDGAFGLKSGLLQGKILINTDAEEEGELCIGCAGGANVNSRLAYREVSIEKDWSTFRISVTGLRGGHSGVDIHRGRGNAVALLFRLLKSAITELNLRIKSVDAGNLRNAIPREAFSLVAVESRSAGALKESCERLQSVFTAELTHVDPDLRVEMTSVETGSNGWIDPSTALRLVQAVHACPSGVFRMSDEMPDLVESSNNLAIVRAGEGKVVIHNLVRSSLDSARDDLCGKLASLFTLAGAETGYDGHYPGWQPDLSSSILQLVRQVYRDRFGIDARTGAIHAGLECGILGATYPDIEMISFGPTIRFPHSPDERVEIASVGRFWELLVGVLAKV